MSSPPTPLSENTRNALKHLKKIKPSDGWSAQIRGSEVRLLRRSVPLTDNYFYDLYVEPAGRVVGILSTTTKRAQILTDEDGKPTGRRHQIITVASWTAKASRASPTDDDGSSAPPSRNPSSTTNSNSFQENLFSFSDGPISDEENRKILMYIGYGIVVLAALKFLLSTLFYLYIIMFPLVFFYFMQNCPAPESFDAKKELKRVMRGHHLPEDHPDKPKGWLHETVARMAASVTTEMATGLSGYEVTTYNLIGAAIVQQVYVPSVQTTYIWIGVVGKWRFVYGYEDEQGATSGVGGRRSAHTSGFGTTSLGQ